MARKLFFVSSDSALSVASVNATVTSFTAGEPQTLPIKVQPGMVGARLTYDIAANGQRFIVNTAVGTDTRPPLTVITNWTGLLKR